jgi:hypothetical protein
LVDRLFELYFPSHDPWCFLNDRHCVPPLVICVSSELPVTVEKTAGTICRAAGRVRPHELFWAAESRKSGVAPARFGVFSTVTLACIASLSPTLQRNCSRYRLKTLEKTKLKGVVLTFFSFDPQVPARELQTGKALR